MKYELVTIDCGQEHTEPCDMLYDGEQICVIRRENGEEFPMRKGGVKLFVREIKPKVNLNTLVRHLMDKTNEEIFLLKITPTWLSTFIDKMIEAGLLEDGEYEIPN